MSLKELTHSELVDKIWCHIPNNNTIHTLSINFEEKLKKLKEKDALKFEITDRLMTQEYIIGSLENLIRDLKREIKCLKKS